MSGPYGQPTGVGHQGRPPQGPPPGPPGMRPEIAVRRSSVPPPPPPQLRRRRGGKLPWVVGFLVLLVVAGAVAFAGFVSPGLLVRSVFDAGSVQQGVQQTLRDSYHLGTVESVRCPAGQVVEPGRRFDCSVQLGGARKSVSVTVRDSSGIYEVGYPR